MTNEDYKQLCIKIISFLKKENIDFCADIKSTGDEIGKQDIDYQGLSENLFTCLSDELRKGKHRWIIDMVEHVNHNEKFLLQHYRPLSARNHTIVLNLILSLGEKEVKT